ncbi:hypothetical protein VTL71DRAFT_7677 [Oculimacula yallundae]|uniref:Uncharacterized protein n=1 Tax=Oculimacula yallundae TaxID=86028 RepID=A0ABR4BUV2_9HELO
MAGSSNSDMCLYFLAIFLPFVSVFLKTGCSCDLLINILLDCLGWIPGVIRKSPVTQKVGTQELIVIQMLGGSLDGMTLQDTSKPSSVREDGTFGDLIGHEARASNWMRFKGLEWRR